MSYQEQITRQNPSCFLFLIDQSGSMADPFGGSESNKRKADLLVDAINKLLQNIIIKCYKGEEKPRDYFQVGVIGYGAAVGSALQGALAGRDLVPISDLATSPIRIEERSKKVEDGAGGLIDQSIKFPIWFDPVSNGGTPMCQALSQAQTIIQTFVSQHSSCFPPIVINITDGEATDGNPTSIADTIKSLSTSDGNVLLFNVHLSSQKANPIEFPDTDNGLPDEFARLLFQMSSVLPAHIHSAAKQEGYKVSEASRGFVFNADIVSVIRFLQIGTTPTNLR